MKTSILASLILCCAGCAGVTSSSMFKADFAEIENTDFLTLFPPGPPNDRILVTDDRGQPAPVRIRDGRMILNSFSNVDDALLLTTAPPASGATGLFYAWTGNLDFVGVAPRDPAGVEIRFLVPQAPRRPYTVIDIQLTLEDRGEFFTVSSPRGTDIGRLKVGEDHSFLLSVNLREGTYALLMGGVGSASTGPVPLGGTVSAIRVPQIEIDPYTRLNGTNPVVEYTFETITATSLRREG